MKKKVKILLKMLQSQYSNAVKMYVDLFCRKHCLQFDGWVGSDPGEVAMCNDYYINFRDIKYDIDTNQPNPNFFSWYEETLQEFSYPVNYESYCKMLRPAHIIEAERTASLEKSRKDVQYCYQVLNDAIEDMKNNEVIK